MTSSDTTSNIDKTKPRYVNVVMASPLRQHFDYHPENGKSAADYAIGSRVRVPFGRRSVTAVVIGHSARSEVPAGKLKQVLQTLDNSAIIDADLLELAQWMSHYYHHPFGDTLLNLLPGQLRKGGDLAAYTQCCWQIHDHGLGLPEDALARAPRQQSLLNALRQAYAEDPDQALSEAILAQAGHKRSTALQLKEKGLAIESERCHYPDNCQSLLAGAASDVAPALNEQQQQVYNTITQALDGFATLLLEGITGSGKTEVYLRSIENVLAAGKQALVLVPEIGLTPQTIHRFVSRFAVPIAVFHSGLNDRERLAAWTAAKEGYAKIIIGTRSAVFTPMAKPGLVIIDEEHDNSYKQQDGIRYSARDIAIVRARSHNIPVLLGSATPSLETLRNVQAKKYRRLLLTQRAGNARPPVIELVDIRRQQLHEGLTDAAIAAIADTLRRGKQAMVFVNRRGFAPILMCHDCGWYAQCPHCDARLTVHKQKQTTLLRCHHCDYSAQTPSHCQRCQSRQLLNIGQGTQKTTEALAGLFPECPVIRIDRDSTQGKQAMGEHIDTINRGEPAILVGTQMLAKGHHFAALELVIVLDIDQGLYNADFRAPEKTIQLLTQVAGRAGRSSASGKVIIQTHLPEHPLLQLWQTEGYQGLIDTLLTERSLRSLPPYSHIAILRADSPKPEQALAFLAELARLGSSNIDCQLIGPIAAMMEKRAGRHRAQLMLKSESRKSLHLSVAHCIGQVEQIKKPSGLRWSIDIDPQEVI